MNDRVSWATPLFLLLLVASFMGNWGVNPPWIRVVLGGLTSVIFLVIVVGQHKDHRRRNRFRRQGCCSCGYDLRATPVVETSQHWVDVWRRMKSTKKIVVCPECGKKQVLWEHE